MTDAKKPERMVDIDKCFEPGCRFIPVWAPKLRVPAKDWPLDQHNPLELMMGFTFCARHGERFKGTRYRRFLEDNDALRDIIERLTEALKLWPADFARAYVELVPVDGKEWEIFRKMANRPEADALPDNLPVPPPVKH